MNVRAARPAAVINGTGIGGLAAAAALHAAGWDVTVCERYASLEPVGPAPGWVISDCETLVRLRPRR